MRYAVYLTLLICSLPMAFRWPFFGLCVYCIVSFAQPKVLCWHPELQDSMMVGLPLVAGALIFGVMRRYVQPEINQATGRVIGIREFVSRAVLIEPTFLTVTMLLLVGYIGLTRLISHYPLEASSDAYLRLCKVVLITLLMTGLACDARRLKQMYIVTALSVGFWSIKAGVWTVALGPHQTYGVDYDNNLFALRSVMALPLLFYVGRIIERPRWRTFVFFCFLMCCLGIIGSRSRSGFAAMCLIILSMAWMSGHRLKAILSVCTVMILAVTLSWSEIETRIESIRNFKQDRSVQSRIAIWSVGSDIMMDNPILGVGFGNFEPAFSDRITLVRAAHNIWLQNMVELGLIGHPLWLLIVFGTMGSLWRTSRLSARGPAELRWMSPLSRGLLLGMIGFWVHGMFHNEEYLDLMFHFAGMAVLFNLVFRRERAALALRSFTSQQEQPTDNSAPAKTVTPAAKDDGIFEATRPKAIWGPRMRPLGAE